MRVYVPICNNIFDRSDKFKVISELKDFNAEEVFIFFVPGELKGEYSDKLEKLKENNRFFEEHGLKAAVWVNGLCAIRKAEYQYMIGIDSKPSAPLVCPFDDKYISDFCEIIGNITKQGIKKIVIDDDFRMQMCNTKMSCFCENHMRFYKKVLGEDVTREKMKEMIVKKSPNKYRDAWIKGCCESLEYMAKKVRSHVGKDIDILLCSGPAVFGADGTDAYKLAEIFATKGKIPELRLIGAPYWQKMFNDSMLSAIDFSRHQANECKKRGIVTIGECDSFPRPRYAVSASMMEFFHTITLADGNFDKILKYGIDYTSKVGYEEGYSKRAKENKDIYEKIEEMFSGKALTGFNLVENFDDVQYSHDISEYPEMSVIISAGRNFLNYLSMPTVFDEGGVNVIFGEHARNFKRDILKNGSVLDIKSAIILSELGIDVGLDKNIGFEVTKEKNDDLSHLTDSYKEYYISEDDIVAFTGHPHCIKDISINDKAMVLSKIIVNNEECIGSYFYENDDGEKFLVYNFVMEKDVKIPGVVRNYYRQKQLADIYEKLNGKRLDAVCLKNPDLYIMTKKNDNSLAIGLWNYFEDKIINPQIELGESYKSVRFINCDGFLSTLR